MLVSDFELIYWQFFLSRYFEKMIYFDFNDSIEVRRTFFLSCMFVKIFLLQKHEIRAKESMKQEI